ncbi:MAG: hypothetical protein M3373_12905 [Gemmatimonadota bacterium]|nr:hypothetical protein [Gemmatimonadota bacterium]
MPRSVLCWHVLHRSSFGHAPWSTVLVAAVLSAAVPLGARAQDVTPRAVSAPEPVVPRGTVFDRRAAAREAAPTSYRAGPAVARRMVRRGEVYGAPWLDRRGGPQVTGELLALVAPSAIGASEDRMRLQYQDRAYAKLPAGSVARPGDRYLVLAAGPEVGNETQVMVPTAIVQVEQLGRGAGATVRVVEMFDDAHIGQAIVPLQRYPVPIGVDPSPRELGIQATVVSIPRGAILPSLLRYVILDSRLQDGVAIGDQFTLLRPPLVGPDGVEFPDEPVALLQVVRVTDRGTTTIVVDQRHATIREGMRARLTAKMP